MIRPGKVTHPLPHLYISLFYSLFPPFKGGTLILKISKRGEPEKNSRGRNQKGGGMIFRKKWENPTFQVKLGEISFLYF